jgi:pimeloyl-ACP methyl ester carboxylesterase
MIDPLVLSKDGNPLVFIHANGYPPESYQKFLEPFLPDYQVEAYFLRPFWADADPEVLKDWRLFRDDYLEHLHNRYGNQPTSKIIGVGHSVGAMTTIMAAIKQPELFRALVLIEPVLFSRLRGLIMRLIAPLGIMRRYYPLIRRTLKRRTHFRDRTAMYQNYQKKPIFKRLSGEVLKDYVNGLAVDQSDGSVTLRYSPSWEARIYEKAALADHFVWKNLQQVSCPVLVLRGEDTDTLWASTQELMVKRMPQGQGITVPDAGHLLPLEKPSETARIVLDFLGQAESR